MKLAKTLVGAYTEGVGLILGLLLFETMAAGAIIVLSTIIIRNFLCDKAMVLKRTKRGL
jgi:hypothetical protein